MYGLIVNKDYTENSIPPTQLVSPVWEPIGSKREDSLDFIQNSELSNLRIYRYKVYPPPSNTAIGRGVLLREYSENSGVTWEPDAGIGELGRHIHWFIVEPFTGTKTVRLFLELRGPDKKQGKAVAVRRFSTTIVMRSM
jgi:hypothetical protein